MPCSKLLLSLVAGALALGPACSSVSNARADPVAFASPLDAATALVEAARAGDVGRVQEVLGGDSADLVGSGDEVADHGERARFLELFDQAHSLEEADGGSFELVVGELEWPFPIPLVETPAGWVFDAEEGRAEMLARRVGRNELNAIEVCLAVVDAQRDYAAIDHDGDGLLEFAPRFRSTAGARDGLFWPTTEDEEPSPLGAFAAAAASEGYELGTESDEPRPYHGYHYRMLAGQGANAPGGAYDYVVRDSMVGGFAVLAYPARYGSSGVMSFLVNHDGVVHESDLGPETERAAEELERFDPGEGWSSVQPEGR